MCKATNEGAAGSGKRTMGRGNVLLLTAMCAFALASCSVNSPFDDEVFAALGAPEENPGGLTVEVDLPEGVDTGTIRFTVPADGSVAARSVSGAGLADVKSAGRGVRNIYQLIAVDDSSPDEVWRFDQITGSGFLSADIVKGHTYHFLCLGGHEEGLDDPTLLVSGYLNKRMPMEAGVSRFSLLMTPLVVDAAFVKKDAEKDVRQAGRLARTVGLDEKTEYTFRIVLGGDEAGVAAPDDALRAATGSGVAPLVQAEAGVKGGANYWGDLSLESNAAWFGTEELADYNDAYVLDAKPHSTRGTAEYMLTTLEADGDLTTAHFKMEYAPFGLFTPAVVDADHPNPWAAVNAGNQPVWVIRNGLNDEPQNESTDFTSYNGGTNGKNANGALNVGVVDPAASPHRQGIFEDNNPWPIAGTEDKGAADLDEWINDQSISPKNIVGMRTATWRGKYGVYTRYDDADVAVTGVSLDASAIVIGIGSTGTLAATVAPANASNTDVIWSSSDSSIASVTGGVVTGVAAGSATITVTTDDGSFTATCVVTVPAAATVPATGVTLNDDDIPLVVGETETLVATVAPANATNKAVVWSSSAPNIATVDVNGVVVGVSAGSATITVTTADGGKMDDCTVTVTATAVLVTGVSLNQSATTIAIGAYELLTATVAPANATDKTVSWSSSDASVATVTGGLVRGVAAGTATITVTTTNGKTATCGVTVSLKTPLGNNLTGLVGTPATSKGPKPQLGANSSNSGSFETDEYRGVVTWSHANMEAVGAAHYGVLFDPENDGFWNSMAYTATVVLTPKPGFSFANVTANSFSHDGCNTISNLAVGANPSPDQAMVTIVFPATAANSGSINGDNVTM